MSIETLKRIVETIGWVGGVLYLIDFVHLRIQGFFLQRALRKERPLPPPLREGMEYPQTPNEPDRAPYPPPPIGAIISCPSGCLCGTTGPHPRSRACGPCVRTYPRPLQGPADCKHSAKDWYRIISTGAVGCDACDEVASGSAGKVVHPFQGAGASCALCDLPASSVIHTTEPRP